MKKLFIYYSRTGNGETVAEYLSDNGYEVRRVFPVKDLPKSFFFGMLSGGFKATLKKKAKLQEYDKDISSFDHIYLGSPIWNARFSCPLNELLSELDLTNKMITFVLYSGSGEAKKAVERINKEYPNAEIIILKEPKKYPEELKKLD